MNHFYFYSATCFFYHIKEIICDGSIIWEKRVCNHKELKKMLKELKENLSENNENLETVVLNNLSYLGGYKEND